MPTRVGRIASTHWSQFACAENSHVNTAYYELVADAMQGEPPPISVNLSWATSNWDEVLRDNSYSVCSPTEVCTCRLLGYEVDVLYGIL